MNEAFVHGFMDEIEKNSGMVKAITGKVVETGKAIAKPVTQYLQKRRMRKETPTLESARQQALGSMDLFTNQMGKTMPPAGG